MALTGRFTFRRSFWGRIVLQVEEEVKAFWPQSRRSPFRRRWRDATLMDLAAPELRPLIDLRYKPQFMAQYDYLASDGSSRHVAAEQGGAATAHESPSVVRPLPEASARLSDRPRSSDRDLTVEVDDPQALFRRRQARPHGPA
jgi:hypothetical protein